MIDAAARVPEVAGPRWPDAPRSSSRFRELLNARNGKFVTIITSEHGKVVSDALGEVSRCHTDSKSPCQ